MQMQEIFKILLAALFGGAITGIGTFVKMSQQLAVIQESLRSIQETLGIEKTRNDHQDTKIEALQIKGATMEEAIRSIKEDTTEIKMLLKGIGN